MLVSFKGDEEKLIDSVISVLDGGREKFTFQEMNIISELQHKGIIINLTYCATSNRLCENL